MGFQPEQINALWQLYLTDQATPDQVKELFAYLKDPANDAGIEGQLQQAMQQSGLWDAYQPGTERNAAALEAIFAARQSLQDARAQVAPPAIPAVHRVHFIRRWGWVAASVIIIAAGLLYFLTDRKEEKGTAPVLAESGEVVPGKYGALLTLSDGSVVSLDTIRNGRVELEGGATARVLDGKLIYDEKAGAEVFNTMSTPEGRIFQITLPDGTNVWLNAGSSIRYPTAFKGKDRTVKITGEAYLEVAKNPALPFRVELENQSAIEVLGTSFNVNAYRNEETVNTTLIEGAVVVSADGVRQRLSPGQQAQVAGKNIKLANANVEQVIAWKNGLFDFTGKDIKVVLREIARWYNLEIVYEVEPGPEEIMGKMQRNLALPQVMKILNGLDIHYKIEGRKLIIAK